MNSRAPSGELRRRSFAHVLHHDTELPGDLVERLWRGPQALLAGGELLQDKPRCTVVRIDHPAGTFVLKRHNWGGPIRAVRQWRRPSPCRRSWIEGRRLYAAGVPTPRPRAYAERLLGPFNTSSYLLTDYVPGKSLYRFMRFGKPTIEMVHDLAQQVAAIWQQLEDLQVSHNDLKAENFQIDESRRLWLIDLEKMIHHANRDEARQRQAKDAHLLLHPRNWRSWPAAAEIFRREILKTPAAIAATCHGNAAAHPLLQPRPATNRTTELLTVLITCGNDARTIANCLDSVRDIADEIVIADTGSTDGTLDIAREMVNGHIIMKCGSDEAHAHNSALQQARQHWILAIKGNECVSADLAKEIQDLLSSSPAEDGFRITRRYYYWGRLLKFGAFRNDSSVRLFCRSAGHCVVRDGRAEWMVPSQRIALLKSKLLYEPCGSIAQQIRGIQQEARRAAQLAPRGQRARLFAVVGLAPWRFFKSYVLRGGWLDGRAAMHAALLSEIALYLRELALWEREHTRPPPRPLGNERRELLRPGAAAPAAEMPSRKAA